MGIERLQHPLDAAVDQPLGRDFLDVLTVDRAQRRGEDAILLRDLVLACQHAAVDTANDRRKNDGKQRSLEEARMTHRAS
jgi:hypothetical protein